MRRSAYVVRRAQLTEAFARAQNVCTLRHCRSHTAEELPTACATTRIQGFSRELSIFRVCWASRVVHSSTTQHAPGILASDQSKTKAKTKRDSPVLSRGSFR